MNNISESEHYPARAAFMRFCIEFYPRWKILCQSVERERQLLKPDEDLALYYQCHRDPFINDLVFHLETLDLTPAIASLPTTVIGQVLASEQPIEAIKQWLDTEFRVALSGALTDEVLNYLEETVRDFDPFIGIVSLPADEL